MAAFFDREVKRVEFAAERAVVRANEKRAHDVANMEKEKVWAPHYRLHSESVLCISVIAMLCVVLLQEEKELKQEESWEDRAKKVRLQLILTDSH